MVLGRAVDEPAHEAIIPVPNKVVDGRTEVSLPTGATVRDGEGCSGSIRTNHATMRTFYANGRWVHGPVVRSILSSRSAYARGIQIQQGYDMKRRALSSKPMVNPEGDKVVSGMLGDAAVCWRATQDRTARRMRLTREKNPGKMSKDLDEYTIADSTLGDGAIEAILGEGRGEIREENLRKVMPANIPPLYTLRMEGAGMEAADGRAEASSI